MPSRRFIFDSPDRFVADALGQPGHRTFYLQAAQGRRIVTVVLEKSQVAVLAERLAELLREVEGRGVRMPPGTDANGAKGLDEPIVEAFRVGGMTLSWDGSSEVVIVEAREIVDEESADDDDDAADDADGPDMLRVLLTAPAARGFIERATEVLGAGRPPCPLCGLPLNPEGHICPRRNGYMH